MNSDTQPQLISSPHNARFKRWAKLLDSRGIERFQQCLVCGEKVVAEVLQHDPSRCLELVCPSGKLPSLLVPPAVRIFSIPRGLFNQLDVFGTQRPLLICHTPEIPYVDLRERPRGLELLCPLGDPANVGALVRTAAGMGVQRVILLQEAAHPFHPKAVRAASGAIFDQPFFRGPSIKLLGDVKGLIGLDKDGDSLAQFRWPEKVRLLVGQEGQGLVHRGKVRTVAIPMTGMIESFNAVVATGIALYAYRLQHSTKP